MNTLQSIWNGLDWSYLMNIVLSVVPSLLCITFHEVSHGYVAYRLGDTTAKDAGRLTLKVSPNVPRRRRRRCARRADGAPRRLR